MGHNKAKDKTKENGKMKKLKSQTETNESNKSKNSKLNGQKF